MAPDNPAVKAAPMAFQSERKNRYGRLCARAIRSTAMKQGCRLLKKALCRRTISRSRCTTLTAPMQTARRMLLNDKQVLSALPRAAARRWLRCHCAIELRTIGADRGIPHDTYVPRKSGVMHSLGWYCSALLDAGQCQAASTMLLS